MEEFSLNEHEDSFFTQLFKRNIIEDPGRTKILERFKCKSSLKFDEALIDYNKDNIIHIGSGSYADVYRHTTQNYIFKLIRLLPDTLMERIQSSIISRTSKYMEAYNEFQISSALSKFQYKITYKNNTYSCRMFPYLHHGYLTNEPVPDYFTVDTEKSEGIVPDMFDDYFFSIPRENLVMVMEDCGELMGDIVDYLHPYSLLSILKQIIVGFMIAEVTVEFEHRDLHSGNILLQNCSHGSIHYIYAGKKVYVPSYGYRVKIIDTTFSRMKYKNKVYYKDLSQLFENFINQKKEEALNKNGNSDKKLKMQDLVYQQMAHIIDNNWQKFFPKTNLLWMKYVIYKLLKAKPLQTPSQEFVKESLQVHQTLKQYSSLLDKCANSSQCFSMILHDPNLNDCVRISIKS